MTSSHQIEVDDEVFDLLKKSAEPFVDTPNSALRRLLALDPSTAGSSKVAPLPAQKVDSGKKSRKRARTGTLLEKEAYMDPILRVINSRDGSAPTRAVLDEVGEELKDRLTVVDRETISSGAVRWENRAQFARLDLVNEGLLKDDSPRGIWEITDKGRARVAELRGQVG